MMILFVFSLSLPANWYNELQMIVKVLFCWEDSFDFLLLFQHSTKLSTSTAATQLFTAVGKHNLIHV